MEHRGDRRQSNASHRGSKAPSRSTESSRTEGRTFWQASLGPRVNASTGWRRKESDADLSSTDGSSMVMASDRCSYLWSGVPRRGIRSSFAYETALKMMKPYLLAYIISGAAGANSSLWPEKAQLNATMQTAWTEVIARLRREYRGNDYRHLEEIPPPNEARKVYGNRLFVCTFH